MLPRDLHRLARVASRRRRIGRHLAAQLLEPAAFGTWARLVQQPFRPLQPPVGHRGIAVGADVSHREPQRRASRTTQITLFTVERKRATAMVEARFKFLEPEQRIAEAVERWSRLSATDRSLEVPARSGPISVRECRRTLGYSVVCRAHDLIMLRDARSWRPPRRPRQIRGRDLVARL